jgi:excisionase family DNA binding protein
MVFGWIPLTQHAQRANDSSRPRPDQTLAAVMLPGEEPATSRDESPWLTRAEAARRARVGVRTVDRAIRAGDLRAGGTGRLVRIHVDWVDAWLEARPGRRRRGGVGVTATNPSATAVASERY